VLLPCPAWASLGHVPGAACSCKQQLARTSRRAPGSLPRRDNAEGYGGRRTLWDQADADAGAAADSHGRQPGGAVLGRPADPAPDAADGLGGTGGLPARPTRASPWPHLLYACTRRCPASGDGCGCAAGHRVVHQRGRGPAELSEQARLQNHAGVRRLDTDRSAHLGERGPPLLRQVAPAHHLAPAPALVGGPHVHATPAHARARPRPPACRSCQPVARAHSRHATPRHTLPPLRRYVFSFLILRSATPEGIYSYMRAHIGDQPGSLRAFLAVASFLPCRWVATGQAVGRAATACTACAACTVCTACAAARDAPGPAPPRR
jgi:hypothetical protein